MLHEGELLTDTKRFLRRWQRRRAAVAPSAWEFPLLRLHEAAEPDSPLQELIVLRCAPDAAVPGAAERGLTLDVAPAADFERSVRYGSTLKREQLRLFARGDFDAWLSALCSRAQAPTPAPAPVAAPAPPPAAAVAPPLVLPEAPLAMESAAVAAEEAEAAAPDPEAHVPPPAPAGSAGPLERAFSLAAGAQAADERGDALGAAAAFAAAADEFEAQLPAVDDERSRALVEAQVAELRAAAAAAEARVGPMDAAFATADRAAKAEADGDEAAAAAGFREAADAFEAHLPAVGDERSRALVEAQVAELRARAHQLEGRVLPSLEERLRALQAFRPPGAPPTATEMHARLDRLRGVGGSPTAAVGELEERLSRLTGRPVLASAGDDLASAAGGPDDVDPAAFLAGREDVELQRELRDALDLPVDADVDAVLREARGGLGLTLEVDAVVAQAMDEAAFLSSSSSDSGSGSGSDDEPADDGKADDPACNADVRSALAAAEAAMRDGAGAAGGSGAPPAAEEGGEGGEDDGEQPE